MMEKEPWMIEAINVLIDRAVREVEPAKNNEELRLIILSACAHLGKLFYFEKEGFWGHLDELCKKHDFKEYKRLILLYLRKFLWNHIK